MKLRVGQTVFFKLDGRDLSGTVRGFKDQKVVVTYGESHHNLKEGLFEESSLEMKYLVKFLREEHNFLLNNYSRIRISTYFECRQMEGGRNDSNEGFINRIERKLGKHENFTSLSGRIKLPEGTSVYIRPGGLISESGSINLLVYCMSLLPKKLINETFGKERFDKEINSYYVIDCEHRTRFIHELIQRLKNNLKLRDFVPTARDLINLNGGLKSLDVVAVSQQVLYNNDCSVSLNGKHFFNEIILSTFCKSLKYSDDREFRIVFIPTITDSHDQVIPLGIGSDLRFLDLEPITELPIYSPLVFKSS